MSAFPSSPWAHFRCRHARRPRSFGVVKLGKRLSNFLRVRRFRVQLKDASKTRLRKFGFVRFLGGQAKMIKVGRILRSLLGCLLEQSHGRIEYTHLVEGATEGVRGVGRIRHAFPRGLRQRNNVTQIAAMLEKQVAEIVGNRWLIRFCLMCLAINLFSFLPITVFFMQKSKGEVGLYVLRFLLDDSLVVGCRGGVFTRHTLKLG